MVFRKPLGPTFVAVEEKDDPNETLEQKKARLAQMEARTTELGPLVQECRLLTHHAQKLRVAIHTLEERARERQVLTNCRYTPSPEVMEEHYTAPGANVTAEFSSRKQAEDLCDVVSGTRSREVLSFEVEWAGAGKYTATFVEISPKTFTATFRKPTTTHRPPRFLVICGVPSRSYTGTTTFTGFRIVARTDNPKELRGLVKDHYEDCAGMIDILDLVTGDFYEGDTEEKEP